MSVSTTHKVWTHSGASGVHKLVLLALADSAGKNDVSELSLRDMGAMCGLSKTRVDEIIQSLIRSGALRILSAGAGRGKPSRYKLIFNDAEGNRTGEIVEGDLPDTYGEEIPVSEDLEEGKVFPIVKGEDALQASQVAPLTVQADEVTHMGLSAVLSAARVNAPDDQPFCWHRREHRDELQAYVSKTGKSLTQICQELNDAIDKGRKLKRQPRRISEILALIERDRP
jgi:hypothetical protein